MAICKCKNGHTFTSRVIEDSPEINYLEVADDCCPECGEVQFEIEDINYDEDFVDEQR